MVLTKSMVPLSSILIVPSGVAKLWYQPLEASPLCCDPRLDLRIELNRVGVATKYYGNLETIRVNPINRERTKQTQFRMIKVKNSSLNHSLSMTRSANNIDSFEIRDSMDKG